MDGSIFGWIGGTLTNLSLLPQIVKAIRTKSVNDISIAMFWTLFAGIFCWFIYGILLHDRVIVLMNLLSLIFVGSMIYLYYRYHRP